MNKKKIAINKVDKHLSFRNKKNVIKSPANHIIRLTEKNINKCIH